MKLRFGKLHITGGTPLAHIFFTISLVTAKTCSGSLVLFGCGTKALLLAQAPAVLEQGGWRPKL